MRYDLILERMRNGLMEEKVIRSIHEYTVNDGAAREALLSVDARDGWELSDIRLSKDQGYFR